MKASTLASLVASAGTLLWATGASAVSLPFSDNFDEYAQSGTTLNWPGEGPWVADRGTIDLILDNGAGDYGIDCYYGGAGGSNGGCVDLDGSTNDSGIFHTVSSTPVSFERGKTYQLSAYVSGNQRGGSSDDVEFGIRAAGSGSPFDVLFGQRIDDLAFDAPFQLYTLTFTAATDFLGEIFFSNPGGRDNVGAILDNVSLSVVPIPAAGWLLISGLIGLVGVARRRAG